MIELDEDEFQSVFNRGQASGVAVVSTDGQWLKVNEYLCDMLGFEKEELLTKTFQELTHPEDLHTEQRYLQRLTAGTIDHYQLKKRYFHKHGHIVWGVLNRSARRDSSGQLLYFVSHIRDITTEKQAERAPSLLGKIRGFFQRS